jgi:hypothetical protein
MIGTAVGAVAGVVLTACLPQHCAAFLVSLALWAAACALVATLLRNFASYAAALAGITAAIIALDQLGATGGLNGQAFTFTVIRDRPFGRLRRADLRIFPGTDLRDASLRPGPFHGRHVQRRRDPGEAIYKESDHTPSRWRRTKAPAQPSSTTAAMTRSPSIKSRE